jgi:hypothetical protein
MRPIGGEMEIDPASLDAAIDPGPPTPATGRGALRQILSHVARARGRGAVALPDYLCESVVRTVVDAGFTPRFFRVGEDLAIDRPSARAAAEGAVAALAIAYFGLVDLREEIALLRVAAPGAVIIKDDVQASWTVSDLQGADHAFTSLRKSLPVPDGALVVPPVPMDLDEDASSAFAVAKLAGALLKHARRAAGSADDAAFLALFASGERRLEQDLPYRARASWISASIVRRLDLAEVAERRRRNFAALAAAIAGLGLAPIAPLAPGAVPLCLPVRVRERDRVRAALAREDIYCPVHWPVPTGHEAALGINRLYATELSLVVDQRYEEEDMERIASALRAAGAEPA